MTDTLIFLNVFLGLLFMISEWLGLSKCEANGFLDLALKKFQCETIIERDRPPTPVPKILTMSHVT